MSFFQTNQVTQDLILYRVAIYRASSSIKTLFGYQVHVSCAQCLGYEADTDYDKLFLNTPFSHLGDNQFLFELIEVEQDIVPIQPKPHQPGTGVAAMLFDDLVRINRIFVFRNHVSPEKLDYIKGIAKKHQAELLIFDCDNQMNLNISLAEQLPESVNHPHT